MNIYIEGGINRDVHNIKKSSFVVVIRWGCPNLGSNFVFNVTPRGP